METDPNSELSRIIDGAGPIAGIFVLFLGAALILLWFSLGVCFSSQPSSF